MGYPIPSRSMVNSGWVLVNTFEDTFGDVYPEGVWTCIRKRVSSEISQKRCGTCFFQWQDKQPVRFVVNDRGLFTAGWFGVRKILFQLIIHDRIRAGEHAEGFLHAQEFSLTSMINVQVF